MFQNEKTLNFDDFIYGPGGGAGGGLEYFMNQTMDTHIYLHANNTEARDRVLEKKNFFLIDVWRNENQETKR